MQYNKSVPMLPFEDDNKNKPLVTARDIPDEVDEFGIYVPYAQVTKRGILFMRFRIQSDMPLWKLKKVKGIMSVLDKGGISLSQMYLKSIDNIKIGGFLMSHWQYTRRDQANKEINARLNENEDHTIPVQLTPNL